MAEGPLATLAVADEAGTRRLAADLAPILEPGDLLALEGDLGMGKSAFARALIRALAGDPGLEVPSPTFTLVQDYELPGLAVHHFDLYRLGDPDELVEIGFDAALRDGLVLVEWPDRAGDRLPADRLRIVIAECEGEGRDARRFLLFADPARWSARLDATFAVRRLLEAAGMGTAERRPMPGDASVRRYERILADGAAPAVLMDWPARPAQSPLQDGLAYPALVHVQDDPLAFLGVARILTDHGFRAPRLIVADLPRRLLLLEDLGDARLVDADGRPIPDRFAAAVGTLALKDAADLPAAVEMPGLGRWTVPRFDRRALLTELSLLPDWYLPLVTGRPADAAERADFLARWQDPLDRLEAEPAGLCLRDCIAANLLMTDDESPARRVAFLDIQDAVLASKTYDLASLLTDVRVDLDPGLVADLTARYASVRSAADPAFDPAGLDAAIALVSAQRNSKILGGFARLALRDGRPAYLAHLPRTRARLADALTHPVLGSLRLWYERHRILP